MLKVSLPLSLWCTLFAVALQAQTIIDYIPNNTPDSRYTLHNDGTATDNSTGLLWQRCSLGQTWDGSTCAGSASTYTWQEALQQGNSNSFAGYSDWRLPNVRELSSIVAYDRYNQANNSSVFPNTASDWYWSSSPNAADSSGAWVVDFAYGFGNYNDRDNGYAVRLVRGGQ